MNIEETKMEIEKVNMLLKSYSRLDFEKIKEFQDDFTLYFARELELDEAIESTNIRIIKSEKILYLDHDELEKFKQQLLTKCNIDSILILIAKTIQYKNIKLSEFSTYWLNELVYADNKDLILYIPDEIIKEIIDDLIKYKIRSTHNNIKITIYKIEKLLKSIFSWIWDNKLNFITIIICILLIIKYYFNTAILLINILGILSAIVGFIIKPICW